MATVHFEFIWRWPVCWIVNRYNNIVRVRKLMPRTNHEVERLQTLVKVLQHQLDERRRDPGDLPVEGCGDNSCEVAKHGGMGTNGGCRCDERTVRRAMRYWKRRVEFLEETIRGMRSERYE